MAFKKYSNIFYFFAIALMALFLSFISLKGLKSGEFLYIHDEFLSFKNESSNLFFIHNAENFGSGNATLLIVTFFDRLYYFLFHYFNLNLEMIQAILYFIKFFLLIYLPFEGLKRLSKLYLGSKSNATCLFVSLWYAFNTFSLIYFNGNGFSLTLLVCYALAPWALYYYHKAVFGENGYFDKLKCILLFFLMSFALYLFIVFALIIFLYTVLYALFKKIKFSRILKNILILLVLYFPFVALHILAINEMFINVSPTVNLIGSETYGNLQGGFLYPLLMWFSWGIYTIWEPRNIFTFYRYFQTIPSLIAPFVIYGLIFIGAIKKRKNIYLPIFISIFLFCLIFIKGAQEPYGGIYVFLIKNVSIFRMLRSPDSKFGFGIVLIASILLLLVSGEYKKKVFVPLLALIILIQGYPIFTGVAVRGENSSQSFDRIIHITGDYQELANFLNTHSLPYGYIMGFPSTEFGKYELGEGESHTGQDLLPKLSSLPFVYISGSSGMLESTYKKILGAMSRCNIAGLKEFPIRYYILRNDIGFLQETRYFIANDFSKEFNLVYGNPRFKVYENPKALPLIRSDNAIFKIINPIKYEIQFKNLKLDQALYFYQNFHKDWNLYLKPYADKSGHCGDTANIEPYRTLECRSESKIIGWDDFSSLFRRPVFAESHAVSDGYANSWNISAEGIKKSFDKKFYKLNPDGSIDFTLVLYFKAQALFYACLAILAIYFSIILSIIIINCKKDIDRKY